MRMQPYSFNDYLLQQTDQVVTTFAIPFEWTIQGIGSNSIPRSNNFPLFAAKTYSGLLVVLDITLNSVDADKDGLIEALDILGEDQHKLIALDEFGRAWYVNAVCTGMTLQSTSDQTANFGLTFDVDDPIWRKLIPSTATLSLNGTSVSQTLNTIGNQPALPVITITPTTTGTGFLYRKFIQIVNNSSNALTDYPLNLTGAGLDTASLVNDTTVSNQINQVGGINASVTTIPIDTNVGGGLPNSGMGYVGTEQISWTGKSAGNLTGVTREIGGTTAASHGDNAVIARSKMLANGDDLRIYVDGSEVKRWLQDMNSANTKIWLNHTQPANSNMTLGAAIAGAGSITEITIQNTAGNVALMPIIPSSGNVLIGSEIFVYTGKDVTNLKLTGVTRAERLTSAAAHSVSDTIKFVTHDVWLYYGNATISPYVVDDTRKPIIKLTSTNTSWIYEEFGDTASQRTGGWAFSFLTAGISKFTGEGFVENVSPYTSAGMGNQAGYFNVNVQGAWDLFQPCGVTTITATGKKEKVGTTFWATIRMLKSLDGISLSTVWTESVPASSGVVTDLDTHSAVALGGTYSYLKNKYEYKSSSGDFNYHEIRDMTLVIDSTKVPTITLSSENSGLHLHSVFTNAATGDEMIIDLVMTAGTYLIVDTNEKTITLYDGSNQINALTDMPVRLQWFQLLPGQDNDITIADSGQIEYVFSWEDRTL